MRFHRSAGFSAKFIGLVLLLFLGIASPASAVTITATYTGTVKTAFDNAGVFGTPNTDLAGAAYKLVFKIDTTVGSYSPTITDPGLTGDLIRGGITAALTINGVAHSFDGTAVTPPNLAIVGYNPGYAAFLQQIGFSPDYIATSLETTNPDATFPTSVFSAVSITSCPLATCKSSLVFSIVGVGPGLGVLNFGTYSVTATPIPAALPLLVSALGGLGFVGWRRKQGAVA
jgi:hypothetical protein